MIFRGLFDLACLLISIACSIVRDGIVVLVHLIGTPGVVIIMIALLWSFGWLPGIAEYAAFFSG